MVDSDVLQLTRLVEVALSARDAFTSASRNVSSPYLAALFLERAEDQARIATHLRQQT